METEKHMKRYQKQLAKTDILYRPYLDQDIQNAVNGVDACVMTPILNLFVVWLLKEAERKKIRHLFFLARDSYPLYLIAGQYCEKLQLKLKCSYFYCSRYSLRVPMYSENTQEALDHVCRGGIDVTLRKILIRSGFELQKAEELREYFEMDRELDAVIPYPELKNIKKELSANKKYMEMLRSVSTSKRDTVYRYFRQEGMLEEKIGIVDSGWTGTTQKSINKIRKKCGCRTGVEGYYFGLYETPPGYDPRKYHSFYFSPKKEIMNKVFFSNCFVETILSAPHGTTMGYKETDGRIVPVLAPYRAENKEKTEAFLETLKSYTGRMMSLCSADDIRKTDIRKDRAILQKSLRSFMWNPSPGEAEYYGTLQFSDDLLDDHMQDLAVRMSQKQLRENHFGNKILTAFGIRKKHIHESAWYEASVTRSGHAGVTHKISYSCYKLFSYIKKEIRF